jgi:ribosomal protein L19
VERVFPLFSPLIHGIKVSGAVTYGAPLTTAG